MRDGRNRTRPATLTDAALDRCLTLLRTATLIEQTGETLKITAPGTAVAARLNHGTKASVAQSTEASASIAEAPVQARDKIRASIQKILTEKVTNPAPQPEPALSSAPRDRSSSNRHSMPAETNDNGATPAGGPEHSQAVTEQIREQAFLPDTGSIRLSQRGPDQPLHVPGAAERRPAGADDRVRWRKYALLPVAAILGVAIVGWIYVAGNTPGGGAPVRFATVERADLEVSTIATGRINAIDAVGVSSQLSGQVVELHADFNHKVAPGAPLARLDDKTFKAAVAEAQARLAHAKASYDSAVATTAGANARYEAARQEFQRKNTLREKGNISVQEVDRARASLLTAESEMSAGRADEAVQKAAIDMAEAALRRAEIDLERTIIRSPIDGIVIRRSVELGQTVAVSMEAPTLFTIAHDLREMRVHARVDEADIGQIKVGQNARFSVDAYPNRAFAGRVVEIHRAPETVQNVVTYTVVITAENADLALLPGMTALVRIATTERPDALLVPNAALRFEPETGTSAAPSRDEAAVESAGQPAQVWLRGKSGGLSRTDIGIGASDGSMTEVVSGPLTVGQVVAIGKEVTRGERTLFGFRLGF